MFKNNSSKNDSNFWISYADLMAGLLFVFILLIGAIVSKSIHLREDLHKQKTALKQTMQDLKIKQNNLNKLNVKVAKQDSTITKQSSKIEKQLAEIKLQQDDIYKLRALLEHRAKELNSTKESLAISKDALKLKEDELKKLNQLLLAKNSKLDKLNGKVVILQNLVNESNTTLEQKEKKIQDYKDKVLILSASLTKKSDELNVSQDKLLKLLTALDEKQSKFEGLLKELQSKREKIKYLTGIRLRVIEELKNSLGSKVNVNKDGTLKLSSKVLFDKGSSELKESAKEQLKTAFNSYINALLSNEAIKPNIDTIVIEGHTDSDGGYLYNLKLSQDRALSVMSYLLTLPIAKKYNLQKYLTASGRSYLDRVTQGNTEDKEASRRIELKFRLKNQNALYEIEKILDEDK